MSEVGNLSVNIGLNSQGFQQGITKINRQLKVAQSEFKNASSVVANFGSSTERLRTKVNTLNRLVGLQRQKMLELRRAYQESLNATGENSRETQNLARQYNNAQARLNNLTGQLNRTNQAFANSSSKWAQAGSKLNKIGSSMQNVGMKLQQVGQKLTTSLTLPLIAIGTASVKTAADFESSMSEVKAISGATGDDFKALESKALEMGRKTSKSASESAQALKYLALAGWDSKTSIEALEPILRLSEAGNLDLATSSDLVTDSMSSLSLKSGELQGYLDNVAKTQASANTSAQQMLEAYVIAGGTFKNLNVPLSESSALLGVMANRGLKGTEAANALNSVMVNLTTGTGKAGKAMKALNISAFDSQGKFKGMSNVLKEVRNKTKDMTEEQKNYYLACIGGKTQLDSLQKLLAGVGDEFDTLQKEIKDSKGALNDMAQTMQDNFNGKLKTLKSALEGAAISIGNVLLPMMTKLVKKIQQWTDAFNKLTPKQQENIVKIGLFVAALGPLISIIGKVIFIGGSLAKAFGVVATAVGVANGTVVGATGAAAALGTAFTVLTGPIGLTIAAVGSLIAIGVTLYKKSEFFRGFIDDMAAKFCSFAKAIPGFFINLPSSMFNIGKFIIEGLANGIMAVIKLPFKIIGDLANGIKNGFKKALGINSPSRVMKEYGEFIDEGLVIGMKSGEKDVLEQAKKVASGIESSIQKNLSKVESFGREVVNALKTQYSQLEKVELQSINKRMQAEEEASNKRLAAYNKEYLEKLKLVDKEAYDKTKKLQDQINNIDAKTKKEEEQIRKQEEVKKQIRLQAAIEEAKTDEERKQAKAELNKFLLEQERDRILKEREIKKESLKVEIESIKEKASQEKEEIKRSFDDKKKAEEEKLKIIKESGQKEIKEVEEKYKKLTDQYAIENEAIKLMTKENQDELVSIMEKYNPKWQDAGQSLGDKLLNGLNSNKESIEESITKMLDVAPHLKDQEKALKDLNIEIAKLEDAAKKIGKSGSAIGEGLGTIKVSAENAKNELSGVEEKATKASDAGNKMTTELGGAIPTIQLFSETTSQATQEAVGSYMDLDSKVGLNLMNMRLNNITVSEEIKNNMVGNFNDMGNQINQKLDEDFDKSYQSLKSYFDSSDLLTKEQEEKELQNLQTSHEQRKQKTNDYTNRINEILSKASQKNRALSLAEQQEINFIQQQMKINAVQTLSENEIEASAILQRMKEESGRLTTEQAAEVVKNAIKQREDSIKEAEEQYTKTVEALEKQRDEVGSISSEQCKKLIDDAEKQKTKQIDNAKATCTQVVTYAQQQAGEHVKEVNWETGEVLNKWEVFKVHTAENLQNIKEDTAEKMTSIKEDSIKKWTEKMESLKETTENIKKNTKEKWEEIKGDIWDNVDSIKEDTTKTFADIYEWTSDNWVNMTSGLIDPIADAYEGISKWCSKIKSKITSAIDKMQILLGLKKGENIGGGEYKSSYNPSNSSGSSSSKSIRSARSLRRSKRSLNTEFFSFNKTSYDGLTRAARAMNSKTYSSQKKYKDFQTNETQNISVSTDIDYEKLGKTIAKYSKSDIKMTNVFKSPKYISPAETARQNKRALQQLALNF